MLSMAMFFSACRNNNSGLPDLKETYSYKNYKPFGAYVFYRLLHNIYPDKFVNTNKQPFNKFYNDTPIDSPSLFISVSNLFFVTMEEADAISNFVYDGNTAFISASEIDTNLLSRFDSKQENTQWLQLVQGQKLINTSIRLDTTVIDSTRRFSYFYQPFVNYFPVVNPNYGRKLGFNEAGNTNFAVISWGRGKLFLHCEPRAFSNYFLLTKNNAAYVKELMQWLNEDPDNIYWDDYYNKINYRSQSGKSFSTIGALMKYPSLAMAFWISLLLLLFYIIFEGKRRQRIVPVIKKAENSSIEFTEAIAGLYLLHKSNKNIAEKMVTYFNEYIRTNYFLNVHYSNKIFLTSLSKKSGVPPDDVDKLYYSMQQAMDSAEVTDEELLELNDQIQKFYKKRT